MRNARRIPSAAVAVAALAALSAGCGDDADEGGDPVDAAVDAGDPIDAGDPTDADVGETVVLIAEDFADLEGEHVVGDEMGDWTVLRSWQYAVVASAADLGIEPQRGDNVFYFSEFPQDPDDIGFRQSRIDRCLELDPTRSMSFDYFVYADIDADFVTDDLRVRINPNFYADVDTCRDDVAVDSTADRLEQAGSWYNEDFDVRLESAGALPRQWLHATRATDNAPEQDMVIPPDRYPQGATAVRFSVRVRDDLYSPGTSRRLYLDDIRLTQP